MKKIYISLLARIRNFGKKNVFLSRTECNKFGLSEAKMRKVIKELRKKGLKLVWQVRNGGLFFSNLYEVTDELLEFIKQFLWYKENSFVKPSLEEIKALLNKFRKSFKFTTKYYILQYKSEYKRKITINSETGVITIWGKINKWYNFYIWKRKLFNL